MGEDAGLECASAERIEEDTGGWLSLHETACGAPLGRFKESSHESCQIVGIWGRAQRRFGDYDRPESLAEAYAGLDRLLIIPTVDPRKRGAQNVAAIDAAVRAGVKHVAFMSAAGTRQEEEPALGASYWRGEQRLIATAPAWTILRMNFYAEALAQQAQAALGQGVLTGLAENRVAFVARDDVAAAAAGILIGDGHAGAIYNATGPERLSGAERAGALKSPAA